MLELPVMSVQMPMPNTKPATEIFYLLKKTVALQALVTTRF